MKIVHISDLHLGKRLNNYPMIDEQRYILREIVNIVSLCEAEAVLIAGDVYDKPVPPAEAVTLFDDFLVQLAEINVAVLVISGNHDSPERLAYGGRLMEKQKVYVSPVYSGGISPFILEDKYGEIAFYLIPFVKPVHVKHFCPEEEIRDYTDAFRVIIEKMEKNDERRNVVLSHQFVKGALESGSEELTIGGLGEVDASVFDGFDYVALGHIHGAQRAGSDRIRYSGTPLKYSFSEAGQKKSVTVIELKEKGNIDIQTVELKPRKDVVVLRGTFDELCQDAVVRENKNHLVKLVLTDEVERVNGFYKLRMLYPELLQMSYDNARTQGKSGHFNPAEEKEMRPEQLFEQFYEEMNHKHLTSAQRNYFLKKMEMVWEDER